MASCGNEKEKEPTPPGVYTLSTAYDMAVKSGFDGTLDEFIETVRGLAVEFRSNGEFIQWRYQDTETWYDFVALDAITGAKGDPGAQGEKGEKGDTGVTGAQGEKGDKGETGAQGEKGDKGETGAQGEKGDKGETGAQGEKGDTGATGEAGADGKDGTTPQLKVGEDNYWYVSYDNGKTWASLGVKATGAQGEKGDKGETGAQGEKGDKGETGAQGEKGDTGATGAQGEKGDKGETGAQGEKGDTGATGAQGEKGDTGVGVAGTVIENGKLFVRLTDGSVLDCGEVVGTDGVGIASVAFNAEGELIVTLTDGSVTNCGRPPLCEHTYSDWQLGRAATCTSIGYSTRTCSKCGNVEYAFIEEAEHTFGNWQDMISACTEHWQVRICALCGAAQVKTTDPVGHRFEGVDSICTACGKTYATPSDLSGLDIYNGTYGYEYLGTMDKGEARQALYKAIDKEVRIFHVNTALNAQDRTVASLDFSQLGLTVDEAVSVWKTYKDDNPLYYWLSNTVTCTDECLTLLTESEYAVGTERGKYNTRIDVKIKEYVTCTSASDSIYRIALAYHDLIIDAVDYARDDDGQPETAAWAHNILGVFDGTGAVCEGYARSFQILLNYSGVENLFVTGMAGGESHAWNLVQLDDGNWYWCDLTWDDGAQKWGIAYNYFCVNDNVNTLWREGGWEYDETKTFLETHTPATSAGTAVDFLYDLPVRSAQEFSDATQTLLNSKFRVNNCDFTVVGYNTVELNFITGTGSAEIPETVTYDGVTYMVISLGTKVDYSRNTILSSEITSVHVPKTVKFIWDEAFRQENLQSIEVDEDNPWFRSQDGVLFTKSLYTLIAYPRANTRTEYRIPDETVDVAYLSFDRCVYLETIILGKNVSTIGITNWGSGYHNTASTGLIYGNVVTGGFVRIFDALAGNKVILIDENNTNYIRDDFAVYKYDRSAIYCIFDKDITTFCFPANLASIDYPSTAESVFSDCTQLESFTVEEGNRWFSAYDGVLYNKEMTAIIAVPPAIKGDITIPAGVTKISYNDEAIGVGFLSCKNLTGVTLPETLTAIGTATFFGCTSLTSITIPGSVTSIGVSAFSDCTSLVSIALPKGVTSIEEHTFSGCTSLTSVTIPESVTSISDYAFYGCESLTNITIPASVTTIGYAAFCNCTSLASITLPEGVTNIGKRAFFDCTGLTSIEIPESVTSLGDAAFCGCISLTSVTFPQSATSIGDAMFCRCSGLVSITIRNEVTSIEGWAFYNCVELEIINYEGTMEEWNAVAKANEWDIGTGDYTIHCTDGILNKQ